MLFARRSLLALALAAVSLTVAILVVLVQLIQFTGQRVARRLDKR